MPLMKNINTHTHTHKSNWKKRKKNAYTVNLQAAAYQN